MKKGKLYNCEYNGLKYNIDVFRVGEGFKAAIFTSDRFIATTINPALSVNDALKDCELIIKAKRLK